MTVAELAGYVATHLRTKGIDVVLSGGSCVMIYSNGKYVSMDLDLVNTRFARASMIGTAMSELGFREQNRYFRHPETEWMVEFPPGPLGVGEEPVGQIDEMKLATGILRILSPTDCVKDRLTWYYHSQDLQCLEQAILVAGAQQVNVNEIERWSRAEGKLANFRDIADRLRQGGLT